MQIGDVIASFREKKNVSQKELADALGVTITYISLIENNRKKPSAALLKSAANYFGVPIHAFPVLALNLGDIKDKNKKEAIKLVSAVVNKLVDFLILETDPQIKKVRRKIKATKKKPVQTKAGLLKSP